MHKEIRVYQQSLTFVVSQSETQVAVKFAAESFPIIRYITKNNNNDWILPQIQSQYSFNMNGTNWNFKHQYILSDINHKMLIQYLHSILAEFRVIRIRYQLSSAQKYQKIIKSQIDQLFQSGQILDRSILRKDKQSDIALLIKQENRVSTDMKIAKLKMLVQQSLVYITDDHLIKMKLPLEEHTIFVRGLASNFKNIIISMANTKLAKIGFKGDIFIKNIIPLDLSKIDLTNKKVKAGIVFQIIGFQEAFSKLYQIFERWLEALNWMILEVERIECCSRDKLVEWFADTHHLTAIILTGRSSSVQRIVVFSPKKRKIHLEREMTISTKIISGKEFANYDFNLITKYKSEFRKYIANQNIGQTNLKIYSQYILIDSDLATEARFRRRIIAFLQLNKEEKSLIPQFKTTFHINILRDFYANLIRTKPVTLQVTEGQLFRSNPCRLSEQADQQMKEIYKQMCKELVYKPLSKHLPKKLDYFQVTKAPEEWMEIQCLESRKYSIGGRVNICLRSYASIINSYSDCIFLVNDFSLCKELHQILKEQGTGTANFEERLKKNKILVMPLRYSKYFQSITIWNFQPEQYKYRRNITNIPKLKREIQGIIQSNSSQTHINLMLPNKSEYCIQLFLPVLLEILLTTCNFNAGVKKELTVYTSFQGAKQLRDQMIANLKGFNRDREYKTERLSDLYLREQDIQKIIEYKYIDLKYLQRDKTRCATPLNSFIFWTELRKKIKTPIFLLSRQQMLSLHYKQYLVCYSSCQIFQVTQYSVQKVSQKYKKYQQLSRLVRLVKNYFKYIDNLVVYGSSLNGPFFTKLVLTDNSEKMYKHFQQLQILIKNEKIMQANNQIRYKYQLVHNQFIEIYRVETHLSKLKELQQLKKYVSL